MRLVSRQRVNLGLLATFLCLTIGIVRAQAPAGQVISRENSLELYDVKVLDATGRLVDSTDQNGFFRVS